MKSAVAAVALLWCALTYAQKSISAREAKDHVGQKATVCGKVASANYAVKSPGSPTFLNLDRAYPHQVFTIVIWGGDRSKFGDPEVSFAKKDMCHRRDNRLPWKARDYGPRTIADHGSMMVQQTACKDPSHKPEAER